MGHALDTSAPRERKVPYEVVCNISTDGRTDRRNIFILKYDMKVFPVMFDFACELDIESRREEDIVVDLCRS